jgi:hypothetical protein
MGLIGKTGDRKGLKELAVQSIFFYVVYEKKGEIIAPTHDYQTSRHHLKDSK